MKISDIISYLESLAHPALQEQYDNAGLITGSPEWECKGITCTLDATENVVEEAIAKNCNMIVAHHPIIFGGLKKINGKNYVEKTIIRAIKNDIAIYAIHTNLDNVLHGVNGRIASMFNLEHTRVLSLKTGSLKKLFTFIPLDKVEDVRQAVFNAGAGRIGNYSECSFNVEGVGTFKANQGSRPYVGEIDKLHTENEVRVEMVFPAFQENAIVAALKNAHPYEEVAFDIIGLANSHPEIGSGLVGELATPMEEMEFLKNAEVKI